MLWNLAFRRLTYLTKKIHTWHNYKLANTRKFLCTIFVNIMHQYFGNVDSVSQKVPLYWTDDYYSIASRRRIFMYVITGSRTDYFTPGKVRETMYRPGRALKFSEIWGFQISQKSSYESGKFVSPTHRPPLLPRKYCWYSFLLEAESTPGL